MDGWVDRWGLMEMEYVNECWVAISMEGCYLGIE